MILRRVIEHFRKQEWTAIAIDFVIVVVGVFIGIQVANWNASLADKRRGEAYVQRLIADVEADLHSRRGQMAYFDAVYESAERANDLLRDPSSEAKDLVINAYRATELAYSAPRRATWDEIVSSGALGLLPRRAVDGGLVNYYTHDNWRIALDLMAATAYRRVVRSAIPHEVQRAVREGCGDVRDEAHRTVGFMKRCELAVTEAEVAQAAQALREDPEVLRTLRYQFSELNRVLLLMRQDVATLESAIAALRG